MDLNHAVNSADLKIKNEKKGENHKCSITSIPSTKIQTEKKRKGKKQQPHHIYKHKYYSIYYICICAHHLLWRLRNSTRPPER